MENRNLKIGVVGLGLIGGSIAKAIRQYYPEFDIVAFDKNKEALGQVFYRKPNMIMEDF